MEVWDDLIIFILIVVGTETLTLNKLPNDKGFPGGSAIKNSSAMQETQVRSLGLEGPLVKEMAAHSCILAWEIPWTAEPSGLQSMDSQKKDTTERLNNKMTNNLNKNFNPGGLAAWSALSQDLYHAPAPVPLWLFN